MKQSAKQMMQEYMADKPMKGGKKKPAKVKGKGGGR